MVFLVDQQAGKTPSCLVVPVDFWSAVTTLPFGDSAAVGRIPDVEVGVHFVHVVFVIQNIFFVVGQSPRRSGQPVKSTVFAQRLFQQGRIGPSLVEPCVGGS